MQRCSGRVATFALLGGAGDARLSLVVQRQATGQGQSRPTPEQGTSLAKSQLTLLCQISMLCYPLKGFFGVRKRPQTFSARSFSHFFASSFALDGTNADEKLAAEN